MKLPDKFFLYVGNAYPHKNLERLLEAISNLKSPISDVKLILIGPDDYFYKKIKEKVREMDLNDNVTFYGPADKDELTELYKNAVALVFPSLMEGFGLPGIEAMRRGCPVICSDIQVFHEVYGDAAIYFNPLDADDIRNKIDHFCFHDLNHSIRDKMIKMGFEQANKYSWEKLARKTLQIYKSAL